MARCHTVKPMKMGDSTSTIICLDVQEVGKVFAFIFSIVLLGSCLRKKGKESFPA